MVEIQKPKSALKRPSLKRETVVVNNSAPAAKKVTLADDDEELVAISPERRNWRGIFIALLVIAAVFSLIIFSIFLLSPEDEGLRIRGRHLILSDIIGKSLQWKPFNGSWSSDDELIYRDPSGGLTILNLRSYATRVLMTNSIFRQLNAESFLVSNDQKFVLLVSDSNGEGSRHHVYEVQTANTFPLGPTEFIAEAPHLQYVIWAPLLPSRRQTAKRSSRTTEATAATTGSILLDSLAPSADIEPVDVDGDVDVDVDAAGKSMSSILSSPGVAFVYENDIYYKPRVQGDFVARITSTGKAGVVYNGIPDWTYENVPELNSSQCSMTFSTDGHYLAFLTFNDSAVNEYKYTWLGADIKYPTVQTQRYPKAGDTNPNVTVNVVDLSVLPRIQLTPIQMPAELANASYVGALVWAGASDLSVTITDRAQTRASTVLCRAPDFHCQVVYAEAASNGSWVLPAERPIFSAHFNAVPGAQPTLRSAASNANAHLHNATTSPDMHEIPGGGYMLKRLPVRDGEHGYYRHVVFISPLDRRAVPLTMGRFEVTEIVGWDEARQLVYFMAAPEKRPGERHLYKISLRLNVTRENRTYITASQSTCLTCDNGGHTYRLVTPPGGGYKIPHNCLYNQVHFSKDFAYYVQECLGPDSPSVYLVETRRNVKIFVLNAGDSLRSRLLQLAVPQIRTFSVEIRNGFRAQVRLFLPPGMREEEEVVFPLVLHIDAAPGSQLVSAKYQVDWNWYLSSQRSMVVAQIDGRGSGSQGELLRTQVHGKLGTVEIEDQLAVLTYLRDSLKFVDPSRICAYGWGYGGYASAMTLIDDSQEVLKCAVAVNPIVSFGYHYAFFTERYISPNDDYMRSLQEADLTMKAGNINGRNLMLMHGTADTLVHQEHTLLLVRSLVDQQIKFRQQIYPDEDHYMGKSIGHVYRTMEWYFDECFGPNDDSDWDLTGLFLFDQYNHS